MVYKIKSKKKKEKFKKVGLLKDWKAIEGKKIKWIFD